MVGIFMAQYEIIMSRRDDMYPILPSHIYGISHKHAWDMYPGILIFHYNGMIIG